MLHNATPEKTSSFSVTTEPVACQTIFIELVLRITGVQHHFLEFWDLDFRVDSDPDPVFHFMLPVQSKIFNLIERSFRCLPLT
jgi:hypothetical protein